MAKDETDKFFESLKDEEKIRAFREKQEQLDPGEEPEILKIKRGEEVDLYAQDPTMRDVTLAFGWDLKAFEGEAPDLDVSLFLLDKDNKTRVDEDFVFYNNMATLDGAVHHRGDSRTGAGDGDDEIIFVNLNELPFDIVKIVCVISIYDGVAKGQDFNFVKNVFFRIINRDNNHEIFRYEMDEELTGGRAVMVGELVREGPIWLFRAMAELSDYGLGEFASRYGIIVAEDVQA